MPTKLTTTISKITSIPNSVNSGLVNDFYEYMKSNGASERHQNNNLKVMIAYAKFLGTDVSFYNTHMIDIRFQGYRDGAICAHMYTPQYEAGFGAGCHDKKAGIIDYGGEGSPSTLDHAKYPPLLLNDKSWVQGYYDAASDTSFCPY